MRPLSPRAISRAEAGKRLLADARDQWDGDHPGEEVPTWDELYEYLNDAQAALARECLCWVCERDVNELNESYMVRDSVWEAADVPFNAILCVGCLEERIGRALKPYDFEEVPLNMMATLMGSDRLRGRLGGKQHDRVR